MTVTFSARRTDQQLQIGSRHGYRIDGDQACINAELSVPPYHPGGDWALELWASERPYQGGELSGARVSQVQLKLPTPLAPHTHRIETTVPARLPLQGRSYSMLLALVELGNGERRVRDVASYPALESFPAPQLEGDVGYEIRGHEVLLQVSGVSNPRPAGNLSGTHSLELWAWPVDVPDALEAGQGVCLGAAQLRPVAGGEQSNALQCRAPFSEPLPGTYQLGLLLREWTSAHGYLTRDRREFALPYRVAAVEVTPPEASVAPVVAAAVQAEPVAAEPVAAESVVAEPVAGESVVAVASAARPAAVFDEPELDWEVPESVAPPPASVAPPPASVAVPPASVTVPRGSRAVSINLASVDELARVKGLNKKIAKEIVERRPFASVDGLVDVRGIGKRTLDKIRSLITL